MHKVSKSQGGGSKVNVTFIFYIQFSQTKQIMETVHKMELRKMMFRLRNSLAETLPSQTR